MALDTRTVYIEDVNEDGVEVSRTLSNPEVLRTLATLYGAPWISSASICEDVDGTFRINRPAAAPKAR